MARMVAFDPSSPKGIVTEGNKTFLLYSGSSTVAEEISGGEIQATISEQKLKKCNIDFKDLSDAASFLKSNYL